MSNIVPPPKIEALHNVIKIGYSLEEVRVVYKRDTKLAVGDITIDAKDGDMSSIPRWVAKILNEQGAIDVQNGDVAAYILRAISRERIARPHELSGIDLDFYTRVSDHLETLKERDKENLRNSLTEFVDSRIAKIAKLAAASPLSAELEGKLSIEEKETYLAISKAVKELQEKVLLKAD